MADSSTPLLPGHGRERQQQKSWRPWRSWLSWLGGNLVVTCVVLAILALSKIGTPATDSPKPRPAGKRNLIFMVSDGMGPASLSMTRSFRQHTEGLDLGDTLTLDKHFWGTSRTRSSSSLVTDSAAGATAFSCGRKSYNGAISVLPDHTPCGTVLEAAKRAGYATGLVVTTSITDATPACFASHVDFRTQQDEIALQQIGQGPLGRVLDLMLGGGRCQFLPNSTVGGCRQDDVDVAGLAQAEYGWTYIHDRTAFDKLSSDGEDVPLPLLGLFAPADIPYELDRRNMDDRYPSLSEMARTALRALEKATEESDKGFFLMIEGSRIDHAGHGNDPSAQVREVLEYDRTFRAVLDFLEESAVEGVVVGTSDHETGEVNAAYPEYLWYPQVLADATASSEHLARLLREHIAEAAPEIIPTQELKAYINDELVVPGLGIRDATEDELTAVAQHPDLAQPAFAEMVSVRAQIGWSTHGHSAVDVNVYSSGGAGTEDIRGNVENTDVGRFLAEYLGVDVEAVTAELRAKMGAEAEAVFGSEDMPGFDHWAAHEASASRMGLA
ncbi:alkaline-phosphatase-like protein [Xylaria intraflava]|nr:alkaline-phosphatase-like protein [Xylaria intraflava]